MQTLQPTLTTVPARALLAVDGRGAPEDAPFTEATRALFAVRAALGAAADVPMEGTYAQDGDPSRFDLDTPRGWHWTLAVPSPDGATAPAVSTAAARFGAPVVLRAHPAQRVAELLHPGPYADEAPSLAALYAFVAERGLRPAGAHTEVYLTDPGTTAPAENRTILRVPVVGAGVEGLMPIGAFARLARLTVKAVRHYDAQDLLVPAHVDPHSGYRYYRADQVRTATTIALLRGLDVPLPVVRAVLAAPDGDAVAAVLAGERDKLRAELARREQVLRSLDGLLRTPARVRYDVDIGDRAPVGLRGVAGPVRADALDDGTAALCRRLLGTITSREPLVAVFPLDLTDEFDVTVGVPGAAPDVLLPGGPWATTLHVGPYAELPMAYTALLEHVRERGHSATGPVTETYLTDPSTAAPSELVTRLAVVLAE